MKNLNLVMEYDLNLYNESTNGSRIDQLRDLADRESDFNNEKLLRSAAAELQILRTKNKYYIDVSEVLERTLEYDDSQLSTVIETLSGRMLEPLPTPEIVIETMLEVTNNSKKDLKLKCKERGLETSGKKLELIERLTNDILRGRN